MTHADVGREFARALIAAIDDPVTADRNRLLIAADAFLIVSPAEGPDAVRLARQMAYRAMDWAVFDTAEHYAKLWRAVQQFQTGNRVSQT